MSPRRIPLDTTVTAPRPGATQRLHLRAAGVSVVLDVTDGRIPAVAHWGADLGPLGPAGIDALCEAGIDAVPQNAVDVPVRIGLLPQVSDGWIGRPGLSGARPDGSGWTSRLVTEGIVLDGAPLTASHAETGAAAVRLDLADPAQGLAVALTLELLPTGLLRLRATLTNTGGSPYALDELTLALPVPDEAEELLDFAGRWTKERTPQRRDFTVGTHLRENRRGRTGADAAHVLHAGRAGFGFRAGEVWGVHTAFSGNHRHLAEQTSTGRRVLGGGELLLPGEMRLDPGAQYTGPWLYASYGEGLDAVARRFHRHLRARPHHVDTARPVTLNVWEAVYFDHDLARLTDLADRAAALGVERYVLDDGWFGSRRDDFSGLGDWEVSAEVWPEGLGPLVDHVTGLGMEFGLWFEPEMVNEDSDLARAHPEWILGPTLDALPLESRHQQVLNLSIPAAYQHVRDQMLAVLDRYDIGYLKWDHNRDLLEAATRATGRAAVHEQTLAAYRLMDELKAAHPGLEIESCSSGGARVDLEVLEHTDRVWVSDCIDPLERQQMHRWTSQLIPLELMGSHIASGRSHTTGRLHTLGFRAHSALFGHLGIEWDLSEASAAELEELTAWIALYTQHRDLLFRGELVRADRGESRVWVQGVVAPEREEALFQVTAVGRADTAQEPRLRLPGLDPAATYRVRALLPADQHARLTLPPWMRTALAEDGVSLPGTVLGRAGLSAPLLDPEQGLLLSLTRE
ncbi:alpha-galactosidase [Brachybacterium saurashtrense]|uniref:alpha-galactosidase n=1 Tax=Brachybacterium saurashtrense TaxID=556288 RepID=A0A345YK89_9MICO|nr:alpha-galactosidase [Brachybacterium saurashtrense]AXK44341.1 alpha-galactosidase [Brachybacterium saurashtrense]RRR21283.1 alpha-galactosidase [Brachybacterium saurashtrense]RRR22952.1 alpha-galactosidase [Brachybacterium saurashtrense]